jgi:hypothetical protein
MPRKAQKTKKPQKRPAPKKQTSPPKIIIRNAPTVRNANPAGKGAEEEPQGIRGSHVVAGVGAGAVATTLGVAVVGKGWIGPKWTAGILVGTGALTAGAGYMLEAEHLMAAGVGVASTGVLQLANQVTVDMFEASERKEAEERARERRAQRARELLASEAGKGNQRNRRVVIIDEDGYEMIGHDPDMVDRDELDDNPAAA